MNPKELIRDAAKVKATFREKDGKLIATEPTLIYFPKRFSEKKLAQIGTEITVIGFLAYVVGKHYCASHIPAMLAFRPSSFRTVVIDDIEYNELSFEKGSVIIQNLNLVKTDTLPYFIFDELISKGNIPWYMGYEDLLKMFSSVRQYAGLSLGSNNTVMELIASNISRNSGDLAEYYRHAVKTRNDLNNKPVKFIPFRSVIYGATNTTSRLLGAYFDDNMLSALSNPSERVESVEALLRS